ncbi:MAG: glycosyltransferase family 2 protein [Acidimicrobiales bacterium]
MIPGMVPVLSVSVVMPAHNEASFLDAAVRAVVAGLSERGLDFEVIVAENGSADATADVAGRLAVELAEVRDLSLARADYGAALRAGFIAATKDVVVNFDIDYYDLEFLDRALQVLAEPEGPVVVVGTKRGPGATDTRPLPRRLVTAGFSFVLRHGFGLRVSDTHGMKAIRRRPVEKLVRRCRFGTDLFDTELILRAEREGLGTSELGVVVAESRPSRTPIARRVARTLVGLVRLRLTLWSEGRRNGSH